MSGAIVFSAEGRLNTKAKRMREFKKSKHLLSAADSYKSNSTKEELCFEYVNQFNAQYHKLHPHRKRLFMVVDNEYGLKKFVCSAIRPTQLPIAELYDLHECASFVAGFILYEPLDPPNELPRGLFSPTEVLRSNIGDCFDISVLLCSLLVGAGYNAYVVSGYAPTYIALKDQSMTQCPLIAKLSENMMTSTKHQHQIGGGNDRPETDYKQKNLVTYIAPDNRVKDSAYILDELERERISKLDPFVLWTPQEAGEVMKDMDLSGGDAAAARVHAWVLIRCGKRDVKEDLFVEPSTGRIYSASHAPYVAIESIWNHINYWVNLDLSKKINQMDFDLDNKREWESLFLATVPSKVIDDDDLRNMNAELSEIPDPSKDALETIFDAPQTWVAPLIIDRKMMLTQYPPAGKRTVRYFRSKVDFFARDANPQCMAMRITQYYDTAQTIISEVHEWFENRKDKMYKRVRHFLGSPHFVEHFHPGSAGEIKTWTEYPGKSISIDFYVNGRLDRIYRREEVVGKRISEFFSERPDFMTSRVSLLTLDKAEAGGRQLTLPGGSLGEIYILHMTQEYAQNPLVIRGSDVAERTFFVKEGKAVVRYHFETSQITGKVKTYLHTRGTNISGSDLSLSQEVGLEEDAEQLQEAMAAERECYGSVKSNFQHLQKIHQTRLNTEGSVAMELSVFDVALDNAIPGVISQRKSVDGADSKLGQERDLAKLASDYLTPYMRHIKNPAKVTREEALEVRQNCLDALKTRLVERAHIISTRLNDENAKLGRKQEQFQRSQREGDNMSTEEYEKYCTDAMFRIQILEQRLVAHEETASKKLAELDAKISSDPRLRILRNH